MSHDKNIYPHIFGRHNIFFLRSMKGPYHIYLEADTQGEGQGDDDQEPGDGGQQPPAHPDTGLRLLACSCHVSRVTCVTRLLELQTKVRAKFLQPQRTPLHGLFLVKSAYEHFHI